MKRRFVWVALMIAGILGYMQQSPTAVEAWQGAAGKSSIAIDQDDLGGVVTSTKGPEAGVWVIGETTDLPTKFVKIVVTDDEGRYVLPDLPKANYKLWVRGYGLVDSKPVRAVPGRIVDLKAIVAPSARAAAEYYPANYWYALLHVPPKSAFPMNWDGSPASTGAMSKGQMAALGGAAQASGVIRNQEEWIEEMKMASLQFEQVGDKFTRQFPESLGKFGSTKEAYEKLLDSGESLVPFTPSFGKPAESMFVDWFNRIAAGEFPKEAPPRPQGLERNLVISEWDWSDAKGFVHDEVATDKRNPTVNANGPIYGLEQHSADVLDILDPIRGISSRVQVPTVDSNMPLGLSKPATLTWGNEPRPGRASLHNPMIDRQGRVWITAQIRMGKKQPDFCKEGSSNPSAKRFPLQDNVARGDFLGRELAVYDPSTKKFTLVDTCFGTHHLQFAEDADDTLWFSGGLNRGGVVGWFNTKVFESTGDVSRSQGWCPYILDSNGNGRMDEYVEPGQAIEPGKDRRIAATTTYGVIVNPTDGSVWQGAFGTPGFLLRTDPKTCLTEIYEPPFHNPNSELTGYGPKGVDVDRSGIIWTALAGSGHIASFDRRKCKVTSGPLATGQQCPEGWTLYPTPGPKLGGTDEANADFHYYNWVDQFDTFGLGKDIPIVPGTNSDSLLALMPQTGKILTLRVPYPLGFYTRGLDGRVDDPSAGWKGRGLWTTYATVLPWHIEGGKGTTSKVVKLQLRPSPLAD